MPNSRIKNTTPNSRSGKFQLNTRISSFQSGIKSESISGTTIYAGTPIGLLLSLTYANDFTIGGTSVTYFGDSRPNSRVKAV